MRHTLSLSKLSMAIVSTLFVLFFLPLTNSYAKAGCCSHHGGVSGCNTSTNHQLCKDGTSSPTCLCSGGTTTKSTTSKTKKMPSTTTSSGTTTSTTSTPSTEVTTTKSKTTGCCSKHGGVDHCDTATGYQVCKDGTHSRTCKC